MDVTAYKVHKHYGRSSALGLWQQQIVWNPAAASSTAVHAAAALSAVGTTLTLNSGFTAPDRPRALRYVLVDANASIARVVVTTYGTDFWREPQKETVYITAAGTVEGNLAFRTVTHQTLLVQQATAVDGGDTVSTGYNDKFGLCQRIGATTDVLSILEGEIEAGSGAAVDALAVDAGTISAAYHTVDPVIAANGVKDFVFEVMSTYGMNGP